MRANFQSEVEKMAKKRDFTQKAEAFINPAMQFISKESIEAVDQKEAEPPAPFLTGGKAPEGYKINPQFIETKSKRVQLLIQPSTLQALKEKALSLGISTNEAINEAIKNYLE